MPIQIGPAKILEQRTHFVPGKLEVTEHHFQVPVDYSKPDSGSLRIFARSARKAEIPLQPDNEEEAKKKRQLPWLLYLQGGPGFECSPPQAWSPNQNLLNKGYQMLFMDQRGTGLSSVITASTLGLRGDENVQAEYLKHFRADSIVRDAEAIRKALTADYPDHQKKWSILGQSFGGFCSITYLSFYPEGIQESFIFGGLPPLEDKPDDIYLRLFKKCIERNEAFYKKFPEDVERVKTIVRFLSRHGESNIKLPSGGVLTPWRFLSMGLVFGFQGCLDYIHDIILRATVELNTVGHLTRKTLVTIQQQIPFDENILYALLHEPAYCQGNSSGWSASKIMATFPEFDLAANLSSPDKPVFFTGEQIFPHSFTGSPELSSLLPLADRLAITSSWPALYDTAQLAKNDVPVYAAVYVDDMYVDFGLSIETAGKIKGCKAWITNAAYHDGIRASGEVLDGVWKLRDDSLD